ncbi:MAG: DUF2914 domain-containing protein [Gammaproteobacteria bacterium]|jgi:hypothetical protein
MPAIYLKLYTSLLIAVLTLLVHSHANAQLSKRANVSRAIFTTAIENREPVDQVLILSNKFNVIYFFTDLRHLENQKIIHRWEYEGKVVSSKIFNVGGPRWRVYSKTRLPRNKTGTWSVVVTTEQGLPLKAAIFKYVEGNENLNAILPLK